MKSHIGQGRMYPTQQGSKGYDSIQHMSQRRDSTKDHERDYSSRDVESIGKGLPNKVTTNRIYPKNKFSCFKMEEDKPIEEGYYHKSGYHDRPVTDFKENELSAKAPLTMHTSSVRCVILLF